MESYVYLFKAIMNFYPFYEERAKEVQNYPNSSDKCKDAAQNFIIKFKGNAEIFEFGDNMSKVYTHLGFIRKAFYCAICSVNTQEFFNVKMKKIQFANTFCHNLVIATIEVFHERNSDYGVIMNSINVLADCDPNEMDEEDPYKIDMKLDKTDEINLNKCFDIYEKDKDPRVFMEDCTDYCKSYSLAKATELFEGSFGKLSYLFHKLTKDDTVPPGSLIFDDIDYSVKFDFGFINPNFFQNNLRLVDLHSFVSEFDRDGIELFFLSSVSGYLYKTSVLRMQVFVGLVALVGLVFGRDQN